MKDSDLIQHLLDVITQQHNDMFTIVEAFIAIISLGAIFTGILQWRLSDKQIEKMRKSFKEDYGIDDLQARIKEANELNDKLKLNITSNARIQIDTVGSLLPIVDLLDSSGRRANILANFSIAIESARQTGLLHGPVLREAMAYSINYISMYKKAENTHELTTGEINNFGVALKVIEKQLDKDPQSPKVVVRFVQAKRFFDRKYTNPTIERLKSEKNKKADLAGKKDATVKTVRDNSAKDH